MAAFIDLEGAIDKTKHNSINRALRKFKAEPVITDWISELVS